MSAQRTCVVLLFVTAALNGVAITVSTAPEQAFFISTLVSVALIYSWCRFDAAARKASLPAWNQILIIAVALVGVPIYFFRTMPRGEATLATLKAAALVLATGIVSGIGSAIARGIAT